MIVDEEKRRAEEGRRADKGIGTRDGGEPRASQVVGSGGARAAPVQLVSSKSADLAPGAQATNAFSSQALRLGSPFSPSFADARSSSSIGGGGELSRKRSAPESSLDDHVKALTSMSMSAPTAAAAVPDLEVDTTNLSMGFSSPGRAKRGASPTELLMEDVDGGVLLTKRPSLKRHGRQGTGDGEMFQSLGAMMAGSAPSAPVS